MSDVFGLVNVCVMTERSELLTLENFRCAFLPTRMTAPRSPRMTDHTADIYLFIYFFLRIH